MLITYKTGFATNSILNSHNLEWHIPTQYSSVQMQQHFSIFGLVLLGTVS
jgi:hypothetical protein